MSELFDLQTVNICLTLFSKGESMTSYSGNTVSEGIQFAISGDTDQLKKWLYDGNNPDCHDDNGWTPLLWACARGQRDAVRLLLDNGASVELGHKKSRAFPIHLASQNGDVETTRIILEKSIDQLNSVYFINAHTPLLQAVFYGHPDLAKMLLEKGAATYFTTARGLGPLELATQFQNREMMDILKPFDSTSDRKADYYKSYLDSIAPQITEKEKTAQDLSDELISTIENGIRSAAQNNFSIDNFIDTIKNLVEVRNADVNRLGGPLRQPPLIVTVTGNNGWPANKTVASLRNRLARYLLFKGASPLMHEEHPMGAQTIIRAAVFNHLEILEMCADVLSTNEMADAINEYPLVNGLTAMHDTVLRATMAAPDRFDTYLDQISFFIQHGGRTDIKDFAGVTQRDIADRCTDREKRQKILEIIDR